MIDFHILDTINRRVDGNDDLMLAVCDVTGGLLLYTYYPKSNIEVECTLLITEVVHPDEYDSSQIRQKLDSYFYYNRIGNKVDIKKIPLYSIIKSMVNDETVSINIKKPNMSRYSKSFKLILNHPQCASEYAIEFDTMPDFDSIKTSLKTISDDFIEPFMKLSNNVFYAKDIFNNVLHIHTPIKFNVQSGQISKSITFLRALNKEYIEMYKDADFSYLEELLHKLISLKKNIGLNLTVKGVQLMFTNKGIMAKNGLAEFLVATLSDQPNAVSRKENDIKAFGMFLKSINEYNNLTYKLENILFSGL